MKVCAVRKLVISLIFFCNIIQETLPKTGDYHKLKVHYDVSKYYFDSNYRCFWDCINFFKDRKPLPHLRRCKIFYTKDLISPGCIFCPMPCSYCAEPWLYYTFASKRSELDKFEYVNCHFHSLHVIEPRKIRSRSGVTLADDVKCYIKNHCNNSPCKNGGLCMNLYYSYICICPGDYYGKDCASKAGDAMKGKLSGGVQLWIPLEVTAGRLFPFLVTVEHEEHDQKIVITTATGYTVNLRPRDKIKEFPSKCRSLNRGNCRCNVKGCKVAYSGQLLADNFYLKSKFYTLPMMYSGFFAWSFVTNVTIRVFNDKFKENSRTIPVSQDTINSFTKLRFQNIFVDNISPNCACQTFTDEFKIQSGECRYNYDERPTIRNDVSATFFFTPIFVEYGWQIAKEDGDTNLKEVGSSKSTKSAIKICKVFQVKYLWRVYKVHGIHEMTDKTEDSLAIPNFCEEPNKNKDLSLKCKSNKKVMRKLSGGDYMVRLTLQTFKKTSNPPVRYLDNHQSNYYCFFRLVLDKKELIISNSKMDSNCKGSVETKGYDKGDGFLHWTCTAKSGGPCPTKALVSNTKEYLENVQFVTGVYEICVEWENDEGEVMSKPCVTLTCEKKKKDDVPDFQIFCKTNCDLKPDPILPVRLTVIDRAHDGKSPKNATYKIIDSKGSEIPLKNVTLTKGVRPNELKIDLSKLKPKEHYTIVATVENPKGGSPYKTDPYDLSYVKIGIPKDGNCTMNPKKGMKGFTLFDLECFGWQAEGPVLYEFFDKGPEDIKHYEGRMMGFSYSGILSKFRLTRGIVVIYLLNDDGDGPSVNLTVELTEFNNNKSHIEYLFNKIDSYMDYDNFRPALDFMSTAAEILYKDMDNDYYIKKLLRTMNKVQYHSAESMKLGLSTIESVLVNGTLHGTYLLDDMDEVYTGKILLDLAHAFLKYCTTPGHIPRLRAQTINELSRNMMDCVDMTMIAQNKNISKLDPEEDIDYNVLDNWDAASNDISEALIIATYLVGRAHMYGDPGIEVNSPQSITNLWAYVDSAEELVNVAGSNLSSYVNISEDLANSFDPNNDIMLQFATMNKNLFWWKRNNINTEVLFVGLAEKLYRPGYYYVPYVQSPIQIFMKVKNLEKTTVTGSATQLDPRLSTDNLDQMLIVHRFILPHLSKLFIKFNFNNGTDSSASSLRVQVFYNARTTYESMASAGIVTAQSPVPEIPYDVVDREHFYYMSILPEQNVEVNDSVDYSFDVYYINCHIWENQWVNHYCRVGPNTTPETVECQCTHLSIFSSSIFIPPNDVNPILDAPLFLTVFENPWVVVLVLVTLLIFLLLLLWAYRRDKKDALCSEVIVLEDNYPGDNHAYLIAIFTGSRLTSGTSAVVGLRLYGENFASRPTVLRCKKRKVLQRDNDDWFLLTYPVSLGVLNAVQLWHNNAGRQPDWFCSKIVVYDIPAKVQYLFIVDQWVALEAEEFPEVMVRPATSDEVFSIKRVLLDNSILGFRETHRHLSVLVRHPRSPVARKQRLVVLMVLVMSSMLTSIMFYKAADNFDSTVDDYKISFTNKELIISIQAFVISTIVSFISMFLFRKSYKQKDVPRHQSTLFMPRKRSEETDKYWLSLKPDYVDLSTFIAYEEKKPKLHRDMSMYESFITALKRCTHHNCLLPVELGSEGPEIVVNRRWLISAWVFSSVVIIVSAFFVMLYSLKFGQNKSINWLSSLLASQAQDIFLFTPLKILIVSLLLSAAFDRTTDVSTFKLNMAEAIRYDLVGKTHYLDYLVELRKDSIYYPLTDEGKAKRRKRAMRKMKWRIVCDFFAVLTFILVLCYIMRLLWSGSHFYPNTHANDILMTEYEGRFIALRDVFNRTQFFSYLENTFVRSLFVFRWFNDLNFKILSPPDAVDRKDWAKDYVSKIVGAPRLRQLRVIKTICTEQQMTLIGVKDCIKPWSTHYMDEDIYSVDWKKAEIRDVIAYSWGYRTYWTYQQPENTSVFPIPGKTDILYPSGGYIMLLAVKRESSKSFTIRVEEENWVDHRTRAMFLELTLYNVNTNLYSQVTAIIEQLTPGLVWTSTKVESVNTKLAWSVMNAVYIIFIIALFIRVAYNVNRNGLLNFAFKILNIYEVLVIVIGLISIVCYLTHLKVSKTYSEEFHRKGQDLFFNFTDMIKYFLYTKALLWVLFCLLVFRSFVSWYFGPTYIAYYNTFYLSRRWIVTLLFLLLFYFYIIWRFMGYTIDAKLFYNYRVNILHYKMFTIVYMNENCQTRIKTIALALCLMALLFKTTFFVMFTHYYKIGKRKRFRPMHHFNMLVFVSNEVKRSLGKVKEEVTVTSDRQIHRNRDMDIPKGSY